MARPTIQAVGQYWAYLTKLLPKAKGRACEAESANYKRQDMEIAVDFVKFMEERRKKA